MARIIYSALVESIRGSIAGTTFQRNAYGFTVKKKPNMLNPNSLVQSLRKQTFSRAVRAWVGLTAAQRADWDTWASTYPQYAKFNPASQLSGFNVFCKVHILRFVGSLSTLTSPAFTTYAADTITFTLSIFAGVLTLSVSSALESDLWYMLVSVSRPLSPAGNFVGTKPRFMYVALNHTDDRNITGEYIATFGAIPALGDRCAVSLQLIGSGNGQVPAKEVHIEEVVEL